MFLVDADPLAMGRPGLGLGFEGAHHEFARVFLVVGAFIGDAHTGMFLGRVSIGSETM